MDVCLWEGRITKEVGGASYRAIKSWGSKDENRSAQLGTFWTNKGAMNWGKCPQLREVSCSMNRQSSGTFLLMSLMNLGNLLVVSLGTVSRRALLQHPADDQFSGLLRI